MLKYKEEAKLMAARDEVLSMPTYQAIMTEQAHRPDAKETAEKVRRHLVDKYNKQNAAKIRKLQYTIETFMTNTLAEQIGR